MKKCLLYAITQIVGYERKINKTNTLISLVLDAPPSSRNIGALGGIWVAGVLTLCGRMFMMSGAALITVAFQ